MKETKGNGGDKGHREVLHNRFVGAPKRKKRVKGEHGETVRLVAVGDILLAKSAKQDLEEHGYDYPSWHVKEHMSDADILLGNLEGAISEHNRAFDPKKYCLSKSPLHSAEGLKKMGFDIMCLANNHLLDYGYRGLWDTTCALDKVRIDYFGVGENYQDAIDGKIIEKKGIKFGFLGFMPAYSQKYDGVFFADSFEPGIAKLTKKNVKEAMFRMRTKVDILVVNLHWIGNFTPVTKQQRRWANRCVEWGADLIIGHGPHFAQPLELIDGIPVLHSIGNFMFGTRVTGRQMERPFRYSWISRFLIDKYGVLNVECVPIETENANTHFQPEVPNAEENTTLLPLLNDDQRMDGLEYKSDRIVLQLQDMGN